MDPSEIAPEQQQCRALGTIDGDRYLCLLKAGHDGLHASEPDFGETVTWPTFSLPPMDGFIGPYSLKPDMPEEQQRQTSDYERREARRDAVELAVQALKPLAGAYRSTEEYAHQVINLALHLGDYIRDGLRP